MIFLLAFTLPMSPRCDKLQWCKVDTRHHRNEQAVVVDPRSDLLSILFVTLTQRAILSDLEAAFEAIRPGLPP